MTEFYPTNDASLITIGDLDIAAIKEPDDSNISLLKKFVGAKLKREWGFTTGKYKDMTVLVITFTVSSKDGIVKFEISPARKWLDHLIEKNAVAITYQGKIVIWFKDFNLQPLIDRLDTITEDVGFGI